MRLHQFTLIVDGPDLEDEASLVLLLEAGCDDAAVGRVGEIQYLDFDRVSTELLPAALNHVPSSRNQGSGSSRCVMNLRPSTSGTRTG